MKNPEKKGPSQKLLIVVIAVLLTVIAVLAVLLLLPERQPEASNNPPQQTQPADTQAPENTDPPGIPLTSEYIVLSYPAELAQEVTVTYEPLEDGQQIVFTTEFTGEKLELFRFSLSASGTDGYQLGILKDDNAGELIVCVDVKDYSSGSWNPEDYEKLTAMQERVNDIITQFYEDPRFVGAEG